MTLTDEQVQRVADHLRAMAPDGFMCPICGERHWIINNVVVETREFNQGNLFPPGQTSLIPLIPLTCARCSNTMFINALALGLVNQNPVNHTDNQEGDNNNG